MKDKDGVDEYVKTIEKWAGKKLDRITAKDMQEFFKTRKGKRFEYLFK